VNKNRDSKLACYKGIFEPKTLHVMKLSAWQGYPSRWLRQI